MQDYLVDFELSIIPVLREERNKVLDCQKTSRLRISTGRETLHLYREPTHIGFRVFDAINPLG
jgi:hypothetical protein